MSFLRKKPILFLLLSAFVPATSAFAKTTPAKLTPSRPKLTCTKKELELKNCKIQSGAIELSFWKEKFSVTDQIRRRLYDWPYFHELSSWEKIQLYSTGPDHILEILVWGAPNEITSIQTQHWLIYKIQNENADLRVEKKVEKEVRKRKNLQDNRTQADRAPAFGVRKEGTNWIWFFAREKGTLK